MVRVLVVEDEANIREMIALNLRLTGMEAVEPESAEAALPTRRSASSSSAPRGRSRTRSGACPSVPTIT